SVTDADHRPFLKVVWRQPVVLRSDEGFEKLPGLAGKCIEKFQLWTGQVWRGSRSRLTQPPACKGGYEPEAKRRQSHQCSAIVEYEVCSCGNRHDRPDPHGSKEAEQSDSQPAIGAVGRIPFEQTLS